MLTKANSFQVVAGTGENREEARDAALVALPLPTLLPVTPGSNGPMERLAIAMLAAAAASASYSLAEAPAGWLGGAGMVELACAEPLRSRAEFDRQLTELLADAPVEPGEQHPVESFLVESSPHAEFGAWLLSYFEEHPESRRSLLLSLGRLSSKQVSQSPELRQVLRTALQDRSVQQREAAVRALETLGPLGRELLASHSEAVPWLRSYAERVVSRLG